MGYSTWHNRAFIEQLRSTDATSATFPSKADSLQSSLTKWVSNTFTVFQGLELHFSAHQLPIIWDNESAMPEKTQCDQAVKLLGVVKDLFPWL